MNANIQQVEPGLHCGGQPDQAELAALAAKGVRSLINLRPPGEFDGYDEARAAADLGLAYRQIGISGSADLTREKIAEFCVRCRRSRRHVQEAGQKARRQADGESDSG